MSSRSYERSTDATRRAARAEIERQLDQRRQWLREARAAPSENRRHHPILLGRRERQFGPHLP